MGALMGYVSNRGMGAAPRPYPKRAPVVIPVPLARYRGFGLIRGRGMGVTGSTAASCTSPNYWDGGLNTCCAPLGTPAAQDPCSILNSPAYIADQQQAAATDIAAPDVTADLAAIAGYPQNVQNDAVECLQNPGVTFTDSMGIKITCPAPSTQNLSGGFTSIYSIPQLAAMIAGAATPATETSGNLPFGQTLPGSQPASQLASQPAASGSYPLSVRLLNSSGGQASAFNVGDSWQVIVYGPPNAQVSASATQNGTSLGSGSMGTIGSNGQLVITGTMDASQVGNWSESWTVGGQAAGTISFSVASVAGAASTSAASPSSLTSLASTPVSVAGISIPAWGIAAAAIGAIWLFGGSHGR